MLKRIPEFLVLCSVAIGLLGGCGSSSEPEVSLYVALDREFSEPILSDYEKLASVRVLAKYDVESNKTVGLANELLQSANRPRADIFWNNEILHTIRLQRAGLLDVYRSPQAEHYPTDFVSSGGHWHGFAARARVFIVNTDLLPNSNEWPRSIHDLADPKWKDRCALAKPLFGTTATHAAVLYAAWGEERAQQFFDSVAQNAGLEGGNKRVAVKVARGEYAWGWTDTDDAIIEIEAGNPVAIVFPDQAEDQIGTLLIPNTLGIIKNGPNTEQARRLIDHLLSAEIEERLARSPSAQIPLNATAQVRSRVAEQPFKIMAVDFERAADAWGTASQYLNELFK